MAWKYIGNGWALLLARQDDFSGVPDEAVRALNGVQGGIWPARVGAGDPDMPGVPMERIQSALASQGFYLVKDPVRTGL